MEAAMMMEEGMVWTKRNNGRIVCVRCEPFSPLQALEEEREGETHAHTQDERGGYIHTERGGGEADSGTERNTHRARERQRQGQRDRDRDRETDRQTDRERERKRKTKMLKRES
jgi:formate hydrogenlyase subunit 6/NADH:ubiquinone oxidoreductase subunit I